MRLRSILVLVPLAFAAACGDEPAGDDSRAASGQVLEGTISDAMLPLDTVRSQPPLADPVAAARATAAASNATASRAASAGEGGEPAEEPETPADESAPPSEPTPEVEAD